MAEDRGASASKLWEPPALVEVSGHQCQLAQSGGALVSPRMKRYCLSDPRPLALFGSDSV